MAGAEFTQMQVSENNVQSDENRSIIVQLVALFEKN
jgi:hypothetical protein